MSKQESENVGINLQLENMQRKLDQVLEIKPLIDEMAKGTNEIQREITNEITKFALAIRSSKLDKSELKDWFSNCYYLYKDKTDEKKENSWHLAIPSFIDASFGYLERKIPGWHVFAVNPYAHWLGDIPEALKQKMGMKDPLDVYLDGDKLVGKDIHKMKMKLASFIKKVHKDHFEMDKSQHFQLLASLIKEGILPFLPKPVDKEDFQTENRFTEQWSLRDYHIPTWKTFLQYSNIGYYLPPSGGKTFLAIYALAKIKGVHLVCVPSKELREQWIARLETYTNLKISDHIEDGVEVVVMTYQMAIRYAHKFKWNLVVIDEHHHVPSNMFSKMATIERKYMMGLCLPLNTIIETKNGKKKLKEITTKDNVKSYNFKTKNQEFRPVKRIFNISKKNQIIIKITTSRGIRKIICSSNHKIFTKGKFIKAEDLTSGSTVLVS